MAIFSFTKDAGGGQAAGGSIFGNFGEPDQETKKKLRAERVATNAAKRKKDEEERRKAEQTKPKGLIDTLKGNVEQNIHVEQNIRSARKFVGGAGEALTTDVRRVGQAVGETINQAVSGEQQQREFTQGQGVLQNVIDRASQRLKDPNLDPTKRAQITKLREETIKSRDRLYGKRAGRLDEVIERTDPVKGTAAIGSLGFDVLTAGTVGSGVKAGLSAGRVAGRRIASGAAQGAVSGGLSAIEQRGRDVTAADIARGAATGAAVGGAITGAGEALGAGIRRGANSAADEARLASQRRLEAEMAGAGDLASEVPTRGQLQLPEGTRQPVRTAGESGGIMQSVAPSQTDIKRLEQVQRKISQAQKRGGLSADQARELFRERSELIDRIQNPTQAVGVTPTQRATESLQTVEPTPSLASDIPGQPRTQTLDNGVPRAAQRLEADAIKADLAPEGGFGLEATPRMNMEDQVNKAINLMDVDFDAAKAVAMGKQNAPGDLQGSVVFEAVKRRAIKNKDKMLLYELSKSDVPTQGKAAGQFIKGFDTKNPEDPVAVMQQVLKARKDSKVPGITKDLTPDEITTITDMSDELVSKKAAIPADSPVRSKERMEYGKARVAYDNYIADLKAAANKRSLKDRIVQHPGDSLNELAGSIKGIQAALDNSAIFRQGWKTMWTNPTMWAKNALKTVGDIKGGLSNKDMIDVLKADIISRPNFDLYKKAKLAVSDIAEEAFPSTLPEKLPVLGRAFKASEYAYTGFLQRQRADVFDKLVSVAKAQGKDLTDARELQAIGNYVNTLTGRANLGKAETAAKYFNNIFFSPRNFWANVQTLTGNQLQRGVTPFVRKQAALNLLKIMGGTASVLATANFLKPGSVEWDPRSSDFGKIKIGNTRFDASGGMSSLVTIASRLLRTKYNGQWGKFKKSTTTGMMSKYNTGKQGSQTTWDAFLDFGEGKLSPAAQVVKQLMTGEDFIGEKVSPAQVAINSVTPIPFKNFEELQKDPNSANTLIAMIADGLGVGTNTYGSQKDWAQSDSKRVQQFKQSVGDTDFVEANARYNERLISWLEKAKKDKTFNSKPIEDQQSIISSKRQKLMIEVMKDYGFKYTQDRSNRGENERLLNL